MGRQYTIEHYTERLTRIREAVPGIAVSTDIIVGFCGETEAQFEETLALLETVRYDQVFAAAYSPRPGTPATHLEDDVSAADERHRASTTLLASPGGDRAGTQRSLGRAVRSRSWSIPWARPARTRTSHGAPPRPTGKEGQPPLRQDARQQAGPPGRRRRRSSGATVTVRIEHAGPYALRGRARRGVTACGDRADRRAPLIVVAGPTATGKTELAIRLAEAVRARGPARRDHLGRLAPGLPRPRHRDGQGDAPRTGRASRTTGSTSSIPTSSVQRRRLRRRTPRGVLADLGARRRRRDPRRRHRPLPARRRRAASTPTPCRATRPSAPASRPTWSPMACWRSVTRLAGSLRRRSPRASTLRNPRRVVRALEIAELRGDGPPPPPRGYPGPIAWLGLAVRPGTRTPPGSRRAPAPSSTPG